MGARRGTPFAVLALAGVLAAAGCGTGGSSAGSSGDGSGAGQIVIGNIGSYTGPQSSNIGPSRDVVEAWAKDLNAAGGIGGKKVKLIVKDDGGIAAKGIAAAKELVQKDKVVAMVGQMSLVDTAWADVVTSVDVPVIGGQPFNTPFLTNPDFFPSGTNSIARNFGVVLEAKKMGSKFSMLYCAEAPACKVGVGVTKAIGSQLGVSVPVALSVSAAAPNYTAPCQAIKESGAQSYRVGQASAVALRIHDACAAQGVKATPISTGGTADDTWLSHDSVQGTVNIDLNFPYFDSSTPATKAYQDLLAKHSLGHKSGASGTYAYTGAKLFEAAAKAVSGKTVDSASLKAALYGMKGETLGGLSAPLTFTKDKPTLIDCWFVSTIENKKWTAPRGLETSCAPGDSVAAMAAKLG
ncbi:ABC transporter substrate-binding protein [Streptomyces sp. NBC_01622]|uniref:ABC transporter substrate-binding protein n=1 Tax=Streptomyces sp. NBC_01622 TaxID=2975903 RepID=UPI0038635432|nr:ABC transporter substrate-binding protein [Streptomyces sp. NBC_01622]